MIQQHSQNKIFSLYEYKFQKVLMKMENSMRAQFGHFVDSLKQQYEEFCTNKLKQQEIKIKQEMKEGILQFTGKIFKEDIVKMFQMQIDEYQKNYIRQKELLNDKTKQNNFIQSQNIKTVIKSKKRNGQEKIAKNRQEKNSEQFIRPPFESIQNQDSNLSSRLFASPFSKIQQNGQANKIPIQQSEKYSGSLFKYQITPNHKKLKYIAFIQPDQNKQTFDQKDINSINKYDLSIIQSMKLGVKSIDDKVLHSLTKLKLTNLKSLNLQQNNIVDITPLKHFKLNKFVELDISYNPLNIESVNFLAKTQFSKLIYYTISFPDHINNEGWDIMIENRMKNYPKLEKLQICDSSQISKQLKKQIQSCFNQIIQQQKSKKIFKNGRQKKSGLKTIVKFLRSRASLSNKITAIKARQNLFKTENKLKCFHYKAEIQQEENQDSSSFSENYVSNSNLKSYSFGENELRKQDQKQIYLRSQIQNLQSQMQQRQRIILLQQQKLKKISDKKDQLKHPNEIKQTKQTKQNNKSISEDQNAIKLQISQNQKFDQKGDNQKQRERDYINEQNPSFIQQFRNSMKQRTNSNTIGNRQNAILISSQQSS